MKGYLIDASSFISLVKKTDLKIAEEFLQASAILDLTFYEVGNAIWKEICLTKFLTKSESEAMRSVAQIVLARAEILSNEIRSFQKILEISEKEKLSFYDSSYLFSAKDKELTLVTEDKRLSEKAKNYVQVKTLATLLSSQNL